jgi:hypothetical protein
VALAVAGEAHQLQRLMEASEVLARLRQRFVGLWLRQAVLVAIKRLPQPLKTILQAAVLADQCLV